ncbi:hypothetical protein, partial [Accumulibacter sp.]|uniref:hypothetical protein n=1 Tax=Accumulibacter sp. TaxID=2053492 RepID=UPI002612BB5A
CHLHTVEVSGSIPLSPTTQQYQATPPHTTNPDSARLSGFFVAPRHTMPHYTNTDSLTVHLTADRKPLTVYVWRGSNR